MSIDPKESDPSAPAETEQIILSDGFDAVRSGSKVAYIYVQSMPIQVESGPVAYDEFAQDLRTKPVGSGIYGIAFEEDTDVTRVAQRSGLAGYPSALIPLRPEDYDLAEEMFGISANKSSITEWTEEEVNRMQALRDLLNAQLASRLDTWFINV